VAKFTLGGYRDGFVHLGACHKTNPLLSEIPLFQCDKCN
jgi:hypothetical protein